jgi:hypothetical protein
VDLVFLIPIIVVAAVVGQPLAQTTCSDLAQNTTAVFLPIAQGSQVTYITFVGAGQTTCYELMAVWGFAIALSILFTISAVAAGFLWLGKRRAMGPRPAVETGLEQGSSKAGTWSRAPSVVSDEVEFLPIPPPPASFRRPSSPASVFRAIPESVAGDHLRPVPEDSPYLSRALVTPPPPRNLD